MKNLIKKISLTVLMLSLSGCMAPVKTGPDSGYVISAVPDHVVKTRQRAVAMLVATPDTNPVYNTRRMAFTTHPYQITYYSQSRWVEPPAEMLQPLLIQTLQNTNHYKAVIAPPFTGQYDYVLRTQIKTLLIDYTSPKPVLRLNVHAMLINASSGRMISSRDFTANAPLSQSSPYGAVYAANCAAEEMLTDIARWSVRYTR